MNIKFKKGKRKPSTLTCIRSDGSITWTKLHPGIEIHDIAHFVVETEMGFTKAFYGILAAGFDIGDFELPLEERPTELVPANLSQQAHQTEHIVNLLQINFSSSERNIIFISDLKEILAKKNIEFPEALDQHKFDKIQNRFNELCSEWDKLDEDQTMEFVFEKSK